MPQYTRAQFLAQLALLVPDNTTGLISPAVLRSILESLQASAPNTLDGSGFLAAPNGVLILAAKNIPVQTAGAPADIGTFVVPPSISRYVILASSNGGPASPRTGALVVESLVGTLAAATFNYFPAPTGAGGALLNPAMSGPAILLGVDGERAAAIPAQAMTSPLIYIRQLTNSLNAGVCSFYLLILPLP